jgi:hypothetical protein
VADARPAVFRTVCGALLRRPGCVRFPSIPANFAPYDSQVDSLWGAIRLICDNDKKFPERVLAGEGVRVIRIPLQAPKANAYAERWVGSARRECLDWLIVSGQRHLERVLHEYVDHYNNERPRRGLELHPPNGWLQGASATGAVSFRSRLGGLLREHLRAPRVAAA